MSAVLSHSSIPLASAAEADPARAQDQTRQLAYQHYENFSVISLLLPRHLRQDYCNVYAFCRVADDLGDEAGDKDESLRLLEDFRKQTEACFAGSASTTVFVALSQTIARHSLPIQPFLDLIDAFEQDQRIVRYENFAQLVDYCRRSANPVGRLVLYLSGYRDEQRQLLSDQTCTALQLANFWQDVRRDILERDRIYISKESMDQFGVTENQIRKLRPDQAYRDLIRFEVDRTAEMFDCGDGLLPMLNHSIRKQIWLFGQGGRAVLDAIRNQNYDTLTHRPSLSKMRKFRLIMSASMMAASRLLGGWA